MANGILYNVLLCQTSVLVTYFFFPQEKEVSPTTDKEGLGNDQRKHDNGSHLLMRAASPGKPLFGIIPFYYYIVQEEDVGSGNSGVSFQIGKCCKYQ